LRHQSGEIEQGRVRELRSGHVPDAGEDRLDPPRKFKLPRAQHAFDRRPLQVGLRTAEAAGNEGKLPRCRITLDIALRDVGQRPDHDVAPVLALELRRHRFEAPPEKHVQEQGLDDVVPVMPERDLGDAMLGRETVQRTAAQARAEPAHRLALRDDAFHHRVGVLLDDAERDPERLQIPGQHIGGKPRLLLVQIHRDELEAHGCAALEAQQDVEQGVGVLASRQADHDAVAVLDHAVIRNGLADRVA